MLKVEITNISEANNKKIYFITCPRCGTIRVITRESPNTRCVCQDRLGDYLPIIDYQCMRLSKHIRGGL